MCYHSEVSAARIVRYARRHAGLTQRELASRASVPQPSIARIESGAVTPRLDTLSELLGFTGFTLELMPRAGEGVDRTLIQANLARSPEERVASAAQAANRLRAFKSAAKGGG